MADHDKIALFDLDQTLADFEGQMRQDLAQLASPGEPPIVNLWDNAPFYIRQRMRLIKRQPGWWANLPVLESGRFLLNIAKLIGFEVHILSKGPTSNSVAWAEKVEFCKKQLGITNIHIVTGKGLIYGRILVDDYPEYITDWLRWRPRGQVIMPATIYNETFSHPQVFRFTGAGSEFEQVRNLMSAAYGRKGGEEINGA